MRRLFLLTLLGLLGACVAVACAGCSLSEPTPMELGPVATASAEPTFFAAPDGTTVVAYRLLPGDAIRRWYHVAERCSHLPGHVDRVRWYVTPQAMGSRVGEWRSPHTILLAAAVLTDSTVTIHEALHDLLYLHGYRLPPNDTSGGHPAPYFMPDGTGCARRYYPDPTTPTPSE